MALGPTESKTTSAMQPRQWLLVGVLLGLCGCVSQIVSLKEYRKGWLGRPIEEKKQIISRESSHASRMGRKETTYQLDNGNWVYVELDRKDCFIHWEVNPQGVIVGVKTVGKDCESYRYSWESRKSEFP